MLPKPVGCGNLTFWTSITTSVPLKMVTVFGDEVFKEVIKVEEAIEQALAQHDWCLSKRRSRHRHTQEAHVRT